jgi:precorrin-4 methylase
MGNLENGSIIVAGSGISLGHLTMETQNYIENSDIVLYVLTDIVTENWVKSHSLRCESMKSYYSEGVNRIETYTRMSDRVLKAARDGMQTCALFYGHPGVFVTPSHDIIKRAKVEGIKAKMLPGISAEDCLIADLGFDPGTTGCQAFEATDFLLFARKPETSAWLIIWQPEAIGDLTYTKNRQTTEKIDVLKEYLLNFYDKETPIAVYEANTYSIGIAKIVWSTIHKMDKLELTGISTFGIPPASNPLLDEKAVGYLGITQTLKKQKLVQKIEI